MMEVSEPMDVSEATNATELFCAENLRYKGFPYRGIAVIAIFSKFRSKDLQDIEHAEYDRKLLEEGFNALQYGVVVWEDIMDKKNFFRRLEHVSDDEIHSKCESFALAILTHGDKHGKLYAHDTEFKREDVFNFFKAGNCSSLKNKLKLFIIHACRGDEWCKGVHLAGIQTHKFHGARLADNIEKDNLILCSTYEGYVAAAPQGCGSVFVKYLKCVMETEAGKQESERRHMIDLLTDVINYTAGWNFHANYKQQPVLMWSLDKFYHLKQKEKIEKDLLLKHQYRNS